MASYEEFYVRPFTIAIVGGECSGKTTLSRALAADLGCPWYGEYARDWVDANERDVAYEDVSAIYIGEKARLEEGMRQTTALVVFDTTLIQTRAYSDFYFGESPSDLVRDEEEELMDLYLVTDPAIPWVPESRQRGEESSRGIVHEMVVAELNRKAAAYVVITGSARERIVTALAAVRAASPGAPSCY